MPGQRGEGVHSGFGIGEPPDQLELHRPGGPGHPQDSEGHGNLGEEDRYASLVQFF